MQGDNPIDFIGYGELILSKKDFIFLLDKKYKINLKFNYPHYRRIILFYCMDSWEKALASTLNSADICFDFRLRFEVTTLTA